MKSLQYLPSAALAVVVLAVSLSSHANDQNPFFAMDTALGEGKSWPAAEQAALLKELGYDGFGAGGYPSESCFADFEKKGLRIFNTYLMLDFDSARPGLEPALKEFVPRLKGHGTALWIAIKVVARDGKKLKPSDPAGDNIVVPLMRELAELAQSNEVKIAFYPHTWFWIERLSDSVRVAGKVDRSNVGNTFNLCHWLKVEGDRDPTSALSEALSRLFFVTINGADSGDTRNMEWCRLIQPLDSGTYNVAALVKSLRDLGYSKPIGFQGYGIIGEPRDILRRSMAGWRRIDAPEDRFSRKPKSTHEPAGKN